jgi:hypothetical protein
VKRQRSDGRGQRRRPGEDGWSWMLRWLFAPATVKAPRERDHARIYLAPF